MIHFALLLLACNDKAPSPDSPHTDSVRSRDTAPDSDPFVCEAPVLTQRSAWSWEQVTSFGGYAMATTDSNIFVADPLSGWVHRIPHSATPGGLLAAGAGSIRVEPMSPDKLWASSEWVNVADAAYGGDLQGRSLLIPTTSADGVVGIVEGADLATINVEGDHANGYVGSGLVWDVTGDGVEDYLTGTGPVPGELAVFDGLPAKTGTFAWTDAAFTLPGCDEEASYATTDYAVFGRHADYIAVGCPHKTYRTGFALVFELPLVQDAAPLLRIEEVSGWYVEGLSGGPLVLDVRGGAEVVIVRETDAGVFESERFTEGAARFGGDPVLWPHNGGWALAVGDQAAANKDGDETGAIFVTALAPDGSACTEWTEVGFTPPEGGDVRYIGAVNALSPDGLVLASSGWQYGKGTGGGVVLWEVAP